MRLCPVCGRRFDDAFERCSEDGTALAPDSLEPTLPPGTTLDLGATVERLLGVGPTGEVYAADWSEGRVALKLLSPRLAQDRGAMSRLAGLLERMTKVDHAGVARVLAQGEYEGRPLVLRELVVGRSVAAIVRAEGPFEPDRALDVTIRAAGAIADAHRRGALHLCLRPSNLFLDERDGVKVVDFGIGARVEIEGRPPLYGDACYMSPEQLEGKLVSFRSDIYGLGALLYFLLTGQPPFDGAPVVVAAKVVSEEPPRPSTLRSSLAGYRELDGVVLRALEKAPSKRYLSVQHLARALDGLLQTAGKGEGSPTSPRIPPSRRAVGRTLEMGMVGRAEESGDDLGQARTLEMPAATREPDTVRLLVPERAVHDTVEMQPETSPPEGPAVHPRLRRDLEYDDTIRMAQLDEKDTLEMAGLPVAPQPVAPAPPPGDSDDTVRTALPEARGPAPTVPDPSSPLPARRHAVEIKTPAEPLRAQRVATPAGATPAAYGDAPATVPAPQRRMEPDTIPLQPATALDDDDVELITEPEIEIVAEEPEPPPSRGRRKKPQRPAEFAVRPEAALRFVTPQAHPVEPSAGDAVLVDRQLLEEAKGPERYRDTVEIRLPEARGEVRRPSGRHSSPRMTPGRGTPRPRRGAGKILLGVAALVLLFLLAALAAAGAARWLTTRRAPEPTPVPRPVTGPDPAGVPGGASPQPPPPQRDLDLLRPEESAP